MCAARGFEQQNHVFVFSAAHHAEEPWKFRLKEPSVEHELIASEDLWFWSTCRGIPVDGMRDMQTARGWMLFHLLLLFLDGKFLRLRRDHIRCYMRFLNGLVRQGKKN